MSTHNNRTESLTTIAAEFGDYKPGSAPSERVSEEVRADLRGYLEARGLRKKEADEIAETIGERLGKIEHITHLGMDEQLLNDLVGGEIIKRKSAAEVEDRECESIVDQAKGRFDPRPSLKIQVNHGQSLGTVRETPTEAQQRVDHYRQSREEFRTRLSFTEHKDPIKMVFYQTGKGAYYEQNQAKIREYLARHADVLNQVAGAEIDDERFYISVATAATQSLEAAYVDSTFEEVAIASSAVGRLYREAEKLDKEQQPAGLTKVAAFRYLELQGVGDRVRLLEPDTSGPNSVDIERVSGGRIKMAGRQVEVDGQVLEKRSGGNPRQQRENEIRILRALVDVPNE
jgi:hypothetical protein